MKRNKAENIISENESMLVSDCRWVNQPNPCQCLHKISILDEKIQTLALRIDQITINLNLSVSKHMETFNKLVEEQKKIQTISYKVWESKEVMNAQNDKIDRELKKKNTQIIDLSEEFKSYGRMLREIKNWKGNQNSNLEKDIQENFRKHKLDTDDKMKKMFEAIEEIGLLQRKMLKDSQKHQIRDSQKHQIRVERPASINGRKSLPNKSYSICNESTIIGNSRQYYI